MPAVAARIQQALDGNITRVDDAELVELAGFSSKCARVLTRTESKRNMGAIIDTNGDGRLIVFHMFWRDGEGRWPPGSESGAGERGEGDIGDGVGYRYERQGDRWRVTITE